MKCKDRNGNILVDNPSNDRVLKSLYGTKTGNRCLKVLTRPFITKASRKVLKSKLSCRAIEPFVKNNNIDMNEYKGSEFSSYNEFFIRKIKDGYRKIDMEKTHLISPADSKLTAYKIDENGLFEIKNTPYTFAQLTRSKKLTRKYKDGFLLVFRLSVDDYHRYSYVDDGEKSNNVVIKGIYHTVKPLAAKNLPIYKENQREMSILKSENFGDILMMEVGALMVGKIVNYHSKCCVKRGMEKGRFEFGGSTVILCFEKDKVIIDEDIIKNSMDNFETKVKLGEKIGIKS